MRRAFQLGPYRVVRVERLRLSGPGVTARYHLVKDGESIRNYPSHQKPIGLVRRLVRREMWQAWGKGLLKPAGYSVVETRRAMQALGLR